MNDYISREETVKKIEEKLKVDGLMSLAEEVWTNNCLKIVLRAIMAVETADVQPVKRGKWIEIAGYGGWSNSEFKCPECGITEYKPTNFCPNCGTELRGIDNG